MKEKYKLTQEEINQCVMLSPYALPSSPAEWGLGAGQIKKYFYQFIPQLAKSLNAHLSALGVDVGDLAQRAGSLEEIVHDGVLPDIQELATELMRLSSHLSDSQAHDDIRKTVEAYGTVAQNAYNLASGKTKVYPTYSKPGVAIILRDNQLNPGDMIVLGEKNLPELMVYSIGDEPWDDDIQFEFYQMYNYVVELSPGKFYYFKDRKIKLLALESGIDTSLLASREELDSLRADVERLSSQTGEAPGAYGKISEIVLGENSSNVIFSNLNLKSFYVEAIGGFVDGTSSGLYMKVNGIYVIGNAGVALPNSLEKGCYIRFVCENDGIYSVQATKSASGNDKPFNSQASMAIDNIFPPSAKNYETLSPINKIELFTSTGTTKQWLKGSSFTLYGIESEVTQ